MSRFYVLDYQGGAPGCPAFISGTIAEFVKKEWDDDEPDVVATYRKKKPLELVAKHPSLDFDFAKVHSLFLCSEHLLAKLEGLSASLETRALRVLAGKKEMKAKRFFACRVNDRLYAMDTQRSVYQVMRTPTGEIRSHWVDASKRHYKNVYTLVIDPVAAAGNDLFWSYEACRHIVSERLAERLEGLLGVSVTRTEDYVFPVLGTKTVDMG